MALIFEYPLTEILKLLMMHNRSLYIFFYNFNSFKNINLAHILDTPKTTPESQIEFD